MDAGSNHQVLQTTNKILRILVVLATKGMKQREQIALLNQAGFKPKDIADLLGTTRNNVSVQLVALRKQSLAKKRSK